MKEGLIRAGKLKAGTQLKAEINCPFAVKVKVSGFTLTVHSGQTKTITEFKSRSGKLSGKMKLALKNVQRGDRVYFEDIRVKLSTGKTQKIPSLIFKVK